MTRLLGVLRELRDAGCRVPDLLNVALALSLQYLPTDIKLS